MKILLNYRMPFSLAHGGLVIQIQQTMAALQQLGVDVEPVRWWDENQTGDLIHYFGRMPVDQIHLAQQKRIKVVMAELLTEQGSRSIRQLRIQKLFSRTLARVAPRNFTAAFQWDSYHHADACVALTAWEKHLMEYMFGADPARTFVVPNGVETVFFAAPPAPRGPWLVCTATITERKRVLPLAQAAVAASVPVWIIGLAYAENDPYAQQFFQFARQNPRFIRYEGGISDRAKLAGIYRSARGFALLSDQESLSLSALEALACECPLLLSDLPWATRSFNQGTQFCPLTDSVSVTAQALRRFYDAAPTLPCGPKPAAWADVARQFLAIYQQVLR